MHNYAVVYIETSGRIRLEGWATQEGAEGSATQISESGLPVLVLSKEDIIHDQLPTQ